MQEVLRIANKAFHDTIIELVKRKRLSAEPESEKLVDVKATHIYEMVMEEELLDNHYMWLHWARATIETPVWIGDIKEPVVALMTTDWKLI